MTKEEILLSEYSKLIVNPETVYKQNPSIIKAAHSAMETYAIQKQIELLDQLYEHKYFVHDEIKYHLEQLQQQLKQLQNGK